MDLNSMTDKELYDLEHAVALEKAKRDRHEALKARDDLRRRHGVQVWVRGYEPYSYEKRWVVRVNPNDPEGLHPASIDITERLMNQEPT